MTSSNSLNVSNHLSQVITQFAKQYIEQYQNQHGHLPEIAHDQQWPSACEQDSVKDQAQVYWQPVALVAEEGNKLTFDNVESALNLRIHADIKVYFTTLYSESLEAVSKDGQLSLLFAWNYDDFQRLQENIIGHILMKQRLKQDITIFFAVTDEEDIIVSVDNETGEVWVERVGCKPHKKIANSLAEFMAQLTPAV